MIILKSGFGKEAPLDYALYETCGIITDMEFFDDKELGVCLQQDDGKNQYDT